MPEDVGQNRAIRGFFMENRWDDREASACEGELALRVYASRLLGRDFSLVLHGGGNSSVKITERNLHGEEEEILYVKGSGQDLAFIEESGFAPLRLEGLLRLMRLDSVSDTDLVNAFRLQLTRPDAPPPSIETFLHALIPHRFVDHTHADALLAIMNTENGEARIREIYGGRLLMVPYAKPGFTLAKVFFDQFTAGARESVDGVVLMNHGIFSFGETAKASYEKMIELVGMAERYLEAKGAWALPEGDEPAAQPLAPRLPELRKAVSDAAGIPLIVSTRKSRLGSAFARRRDVSEVSQLGPATPDHVLLTRRLPMLGLDAESYAEAYKRDYAAYASSGLEGGAMLDPAPRVVLDSEIGLCAAGKTAREADMAGEIYEHTIEVILRATALGGYRTLQASEIFEVEYWGLERAKLERKEKVFAGEIALVTGAASGIGRACLESFLERGAAVIGLDLSPSIVSLYERPDYLGIECDVTSDDAIAGVIEKAARRFGGLDMIVLNAGIFPESRDIARIPAAEWRAVMNVNLDANLSLMRECYPLLKLSPRGGRVVAVGSKNVPAPGPGAAAYSASKAALTQLMRVAAMEWGGDGIRVNMVHPNAVFDTGVWTEDVLKSRAESYGLSVDDYKKLNLLNTDVGSSDVAEMVAEMCGPLFAKITGAQVPIDGGNDRVI